MRSHELLEGLELLRCTDDFEDKCLGAKVDDMRAWNTSPSDISSARRRSAWCRDLDEQQLTLNGLAGSELAQSQNVDELVHLLFDLLQRLL